MWRHSGSPVIETLADREAGPTEQGRQNTAERDSRDFGKTAGFQDYCGPGVRGMGVKIKTPLFLPKLSSFSWINPLQIVSLWLIPKALEKLIFTILPILLLLFWRNGFTEVLTPPSQKSHLRLEIISKIRFAWVLIDKEVFAGNRIKVLPWTWKNLSLNS